MLARNYSLFFHSAKFLLDVRFYPTLFYAQCLGHLLANDSLGFAYEARHFPSWRNSGWRLQRVRKNR
jgi:hypothetical protein